MEDKRGEDTAEPGSVVLPAGGDSASGSDRLPDAEIAAPTLSRIPDTLEVRGVLLASEERDIPQKAIDLAARMAKRSKAPVHVFSIARMWGTGFGFPNPGLLPSKKEWDEPALRGRQGGVAPEGQGA